MKSGRKCTWREIKVGEIYANGPPFVSNWVIGYKVSEGKKYAIRIGERWRISKHDDFEHRSKLRWLADDSDGFEDHGGEIDTYIDAPDDEFYKLPKSIQRLWKEK